LQVFFLIGKDVSLRAVFCYRCSTKSFELPVLMSGPPPSLKLRLKSCILSIFSYEAVQLHMYTTVLYLMNI
jgi:hypothetical protein